MDFSELTPLQKEIVKALEQSKNRSLITEADFSKKNSPKYKFYRQTKGRSQPK